MTSNYYVRQHDDHYHVLGCDSSDILDDRPVNPWLFGNKTLAEQVATLLNRGMDPYRVKEMDHRQIHEAVQRYDAATFTSETGRRWAVRYVAKDGRYGLTGKCVADAAMIEFYDPTVVGEGFGPLGQFVSRYYVTTVLDESYDGIDLDGGGPEWSVDAATVAEIREWLVTEHPRGAWVIGDNIAGYLPESDTYAYAQWSEAASALAARMRDYADADDDNAMDALPADAFEDDMPTMLAHVGAILRDDPPGPDGENWTVYVPDGTDRRIAFWIVWSADRDPAEELE